MSVGAVVACCALAAACTQEPAQMSSPSPTPLATTPRESQIERQMRLDYEAAEEAYRANISEQDRLARAGGADRATAALKATAEGEYLSYALASLALIKRQGWQGTGSTTIIGIGRVGWRRSMSGLRAARMAAVFDSSTTKVRM